jgi:murein DD-endopeptidase MepM/ murein hydrolase activator NlpD
MDEAFRAPVRAARRGVVVAAGWGDTGYGRHVVVSHGDRIYTRYAHLDSVTARRGQRVQAGQTIGRQGNTGWTTGDHLHFEVWRGGWDRSVNPAPFMAARGVHMRRCR